MWALIWALVLFLGTCLVNSTTLTITTEGSGAIVENEDGVKELRVDHGDDLSLTCTVIGKADLVWGLWYGIGAGLSYNDRVLHQDNVRFTIEEVRTADNSATSYILRILDLTLSDEGEYSCQGQNGSHGEIQLLVTTPAEITEITPMQTATVDEMVSLVCKASGSPQPKIRWRHVRPTNQLPNGIEGAYKEGNNLDITSITMEDRGEYECIASNGVPNEDSLIKRTTYIRMNYPPSVEAIVEDNPVIKVQEGKTASLTCKSMSYPRSSVSDVVWYFEMNEISEIDGYIIEVSNQLPGEDVDLYEETTYSVLQIPDVTVNATGQYKCQFKNSQGNGQAFITLDIEEREAGATTTSETVTYTLKPIVRLQQSDTEKPECCKGSTPLASLVTIVTMLTVILWLVH